MTRMWSTLRYGAAAVLVVGLVASALNSMSAGTFDALEFFSYFTIQCNLIGVAALVCAARFTGRPRPHWVEVLRVSAAVYLVVVVTVFWTMLAPGKEGGTVWTDWIGHLFSGVALVADWVVEGPRERVPWRRIGAVLAYPGVWLAVVLTRGATDGWFPYPFLDPAHGYAAITAVIAAIVAAGVVLCVVLFPLPRWRVLAPVAHHEL